MYKATVLILALAIGQIAAQPYCLLTAVNKFEHPADQKTLCCKEASKVKDYLKELCPSADQSDALVAFKKACTDAGYGSCSSSSSSATGSDTSSATGAPYVVTKTSTYFDAECSCTKTKVHTTSAVAPSSGFATGTASAASGTGAIASAAATGSPILPVVPAATGSSSNPSSTAKSFTGAATKNVGSVAAGLLAVAAIAMAL